MGGTIKRRQLLLSGLVIGAGIVTLGTLGPGWLEREDQGLPSLDGHTRREAIEALAGFGDRGLGEAMAHAGVGIDQSADDLLATIWRRATKNGWAPGSPGGRKALGRLLTADQGRARSDSCPSLRMP